MERNGLWLARELPGIDTLVVRLFAGLHDCKRFDDGWDREHGPRAADFIESLELPLRVDRLDRLLTAPIRASSIPSPRRIWRAETPANSSTPSRSS